MENYGSRGAKKYIFLSPITRLLLVVPRNGFERFTLLLIDGRSETSRAPYYGGSQDHNNRQFLQQEKSNRFSLEKRTTFFVHFLATVARLRHETS